MTFICSVVSFLLRNFHFSRFDIIFFDIFSVLNKHLWNKLLCITFGIEGLGGMPFGMSGATHGRRQRQDPTVQHELLVSLEDIYKGCTKKMKITRFVSIFLNA